MPEEKRKFRDVKEFFKKLDEKLELIEMEGFLEQDETNTASVRFAPHGNCQSWIILPITAIKEVEIIRERDWCFTEKDGHHTHPYVKILADPTDAKVAKSLSTLAQSMLARGVSHRATVAPPNIALQRAGTSGIQPQQLAARKPELFYLGPQPSRGSPASFPVAGGADCMDGYRCIYYEPCPYHCACADDKGQAYCSYCCVA